MALSPGRRQAAIVACLVPRYYPAPHYLRRFALVMTLDLVRGKKKETISVYSWATLRAHPPASLVVPVATGAKRRIDSKQVFIPKCRFLDVRIRDYAKAAPRTYTVSKDDIRN